MMNKSFSSNLMNKHNDAVRWSTETHQLYIPIREIRAHLSFINESIIQSFLVSRLKSLHLKSH